jgi:hypothetical protein
MDPASAAHRRGLERISETLDAVNYVYFADLANINAAMLGGLLDLVEGHLRRCRPATGFCGRDGVPRRV